MRVLAITSLYPNPFQPHRATFKRHQLRILGTRAQVQVISPISWIDELRARRAGCEALPSGRKLVKDGLTVYYPRYFFPPRVARRLHGWFYERSIRALFYEVCKHFRPDIVFGSWAYPDGWAIVRMAKSVGLPVVIQVHGSDVKLLDQYPSKRAGTVAALCGADGVIAVSRDLANSIALLGVDSGKVRVVYDGVDSDVFRPGDGETARASLGFSSITEPILLYVGNLLHVKGVDVLLSSIAKLVASGTPVQLYLIGDGVLRSQLECQSATLGIADRVHFVGSIDHHCLPVWYHAADLFVLPSRSEGIPNVLLEASACGLRWIASNVGGISEIVTRGRGMLVAPENDAELTEGIKASLALAVSSASNADDSIGSSRAVSTKTRSQAVDEILEFLSQFVSIGPSLASSTAR